LKYQVGAKVSKILVFVVLPVLVAVIAAMLAGRQVARARRLNGRSLMGCLRSSAPEPAEKLLVPGMRINKKKYYRPFKESRGDENVVVRCGNWKGIYNAEPDSLELYDLSKDPAEQFDLSGEQPGRAEAIRSYARNFSDKCSRDADETTPSGFDSLDEQTRRRLRSLGYVD